MEKDHHQPDSLATVAVKQPEYAPSEVYSASEPPPAYHRHQSAAVQVARIIAVTVVLVSVVLGGFILASAYVTANASCHQLEQELQLLTETADRFGPPLQPLALVSEEEQSTEKPEKKSNKEHLQAEDTKDDKQVDDNTISQDSDSSSQSDSSEEDDQGRIPIHFKLPLQLDFDDLAGALVEKNQRSRMNCIVEKKKAEEIVDHQPKTVRLPFGLNLTTDPKYERVTGERMVIFCESGNMQRNQAPHHPQPQQQNDDEDDTVVIQPIMIPLNPNGMPMTHMPQQQMSQQQPQGGFSLNRIVVEQRPSYQNPMMHQQQQQQQQQQPQPQGPPPAIIQHIAQQIIAQRLQDMEQAAAQRSEMERRAEMERRGEMERQAEIARRIELIRRVEMQRRAEMEEHRAAEMERSQEVPQPSETEQAPPAPQGAPEGMIHRIPIPEEILSHINRLPNQPVIVSVSESEPETEQPEQGQGIKIIQQQRQNAAEMNGRQSYARGIPVHIPVPMMTQVQQQEQQEASAEETRPHYVQPRSIRSVDEVFHREKRDAKRVKRCACDCAC